MMKYIYELPSDMMKEISNHGEVRRFEYDTQTYDAQSGHPLHKGAWIYLPHNYSKDQQYNIL